MYQKIQIALLLIFLVQFIDTHPVDGCRGDESVRYMLPLKSSTETPILHGLDINEGLQYMFEMKTPRKNVHDPTSKDYYRNKLATDY